MKRFAIAASAIALCSSAFAQTYVTSPKGFLTTEGQRYGYYMGGIANGRMQYFDGEFRNQLMIVKEVAYRNDYRNHSTYTAVGRSWKNVTLKCSQCDYDTLGPLSSIFTMNSLNTPTTVFSGSVTWASMTGYPTTNPAPWDKRFPFSASYVHTGAKDILFDYDFSGGKLSNSATWLEGRLYSYYLDSYNTGSYGYATPTYHGLSSTAGGCRDSKSSRTYGAYNYFYWYAYGPTYGTTTFRNKFRLYSYSYYTGPSKPVMHAYSIGGSTTGTNWPGVTCQKLFINPGTIVLLAGKTASTSGSSGTIYPTGTPNGLIPYLPSAAGTKMFSQAVWNDSGNNALKFTRAVSLTIPKVPTQVKRAVVYQAYPVLKNYYGYGPYDYYYYNPLMRICK